MKGKAITEMLTEHQEELKKMIDQCEDDHLKIVQLKKHLNLHHEMIERLMNSLMVNILMSDAPEYSADQEVWRKKLQILREVVNHHLREEKSELFPEVKKHLPKSKLKDLGLQFRMMTNDKEKMVQT